MAIARAIVLKPTILCFDEPTSALDKNSIADVTNIIKDLSKEKMGILIVTHDEGFAKDVATRIVEFKDINKS